MNSGGHVSGNDDTLTCPANAPAQEGTDQNLSQHFCVYTPNSITLRFSESDPSCDSAASPSITHPAFARYGDTEASSR